MFNDCGHWSAQSCSLAVLLLKIISRASIHLRTLYMGKLGVLNPNPKSKSYLKVSEGHHIMVLPTPLKNIDFFFSPDCNPKISKNCWNKGSLVHVKSLKKNKQHLVGIAVFSGAYYCWPQSSPINGRLLPRCTSLSCGIEAANPANSFLHSHCQKCDTSIVYRVHPPSSTSIVSLLLAPSIAIDELHCTRLLDCFATAAAAAFTHYVHLLDVLVFFLAETISCVAHTPSRTLASVAKHN